MERLGPYDIRGELGRGAMGVVYRAWHPELDREVALKVLPRGATEDLEQRFRREAKLAARLRHPHIVAVHDVGEADGLLYLAMDLIDGESLHEVINDRLIPPAEAAAIALKVAEGVAHAHAEGVLHRDIKPGNVLVDREGTPYLADFGLARAVDTEGSEKLSRSGSVIGTPAYMSPEQAQGGDIDQRADVWACGVMLYEMVTSALPFSGGTAVQVMSQVVGKDPPPMRRFVKQTPPDLEAIVHRCLEKDLDRRYPDAAALVADLQRYLDGRPVEARRVTVWRRARSWVRRNKAVTLTGAAGVAAVTAVLLYVSVIGPALRDVARRTRLEQIGELAASLLQGEERDLRRRLDALAAAGPVDAAALQALAAEAAAPAVVARVAERLPPSLRPAEGDAEAQAAFDAAVQRYAGAPLQAAAAMARGDHALAYRLDPVGPTGLQAAVALAHQLAEERRLDEAAGLLLRIHGRYPNHAAGRAAAAQLALVAVQRGHWTTALQADRSAGDASQLPPLGRAVLTAFGRREQQFTISPTNLHDAGLPSLRETPEQMRWLDLGERGRWLVLPHRRGAPFFVADAAGTLAAGGRVTDYLPKGWSVTDVEAGDFDGDGTVDLWCAAGGPEGRGLVILTPDPAKPGGWKERARELGSATWPVGLIVGDADGDGRAEGLLQFTYEGGAPWLVEWRPKFKDVHRRVGGLSAAVVGRGDVDGGCIADLDGDGTAEMVLGTSIHTTAKGVVARWTSLGGLHELHTFDLGHPAACAVLPLPGAPGRRMVAWMTEVGLSTHARATSVHRERLPYGEDALIFYEWSGAGLRELGRRAVSGGFPELAYPGSVSGGVLEGAPVVQWWTRRTSRQPGTVGAVGTQLWFGRGIPTDQSTDVFAIAPSERLTDARLLALAAGPEAPSRLVVLTRTALQVWGPRTAPAEPLTPFTVDAGAAGEAGARIGAARDLLFSGRTAEALDLLAETAERFPGTDEAVEATRLRIDALLRRAEGERDEANQAELAGAADAKERDARWRATAAAAEKAAETAASRFGTAPNRVRRFLRQAAEAALLRDDFDHAATFTRRSLEAASGREDARMAKRHQLGLRYLADLRAGGPTLRLGDPELPLIADTPLRLTLEPDGTLQVPLDAHHAPGVVGVPVDWGGQGLEFEAELSIDGSAWAGNFYLGLVPRRAPTRYPGQTSVRVLTWELGAWDAMPQRFRMEGGLGVMEARSVGFRGRWKLRWSYLPEIAEVRLAVRHAESGALLYRERRPVQQRLGAGRYVLGIGFKQFSDDAYFANGGHPLVTAVTLHRLVMRAGPAAIALDRKAPVGSRDAAQVAGGALLRGDAAAAATLYTLALDRDPGNARAALYGALAAAGSDGGSAAAGRLRDLIHARPLAALVALDDLGRVADAPLRRRVGALLRSILMVLPDDLAHGLDRAVCLALLGETEAAAALALRAPEGPARRYLRMRGQRHDAAWKRDADWLRSRGVVLPGTWLPPVCWAPAEGDTTESIRTAAAAAHRALKRRPTWPAAVQAWVALHRWHLLEPREGQALWGLGDVALTVGQQGVAERWWRLRARVLAEDPGAAFLLAQLYLNRNASREICDALALAARRGGKWSDLPDSARVKLDQWFAAGGETHAGRFRELRTALGAEAESGD